MLLQCHLLLLLNWIVLMSCKTYSLMTLPWQKEVCNQVDSFELWPPPELDDVVRQGHQLPFKGGDQGSLLLQGEADQVVVMET